MFSIIAGNSLKLISSEKMPQHMCEWRHKSYVSYVGTCGGVAIDVAAEKSPRFLPGDHTWPACLSARPVSNILWSGDLPPYGGNPRSPLGLAVPRRSSSWSPNAFRAVLLWDEFLDVCGSGFSEALSLFYRYCIYGNKLQGLCTKILPKTIWASN